MTDQTTVQCWPGADAAISATTTLRDHCQLRVGGVVLTLSEEQTTRLIDVLRGPLAEIRRRRLHHSVSADTSAAEVADIIRTLDAVKAPVDEVTERRRVLVEGLLRSNEERPLDVVRSGGGALEMALNDQARGRHAGRQTPEWIERALPREPGRYRRDGGAA